MYRRVGKAMISSPANTGQEADIHDHENLSRFAVMVVCSKVRFQ
jgi:hypothetical protein